MLGNWRTHCRTTIVNFKPKSKHCYIWWLKFLLNIWVMSHGAFDSRLITFTRWTWKTRIGLRRHQTRIKTRWYYDTGPNNPSQSPIQIPHHLASNSVPTPLHTPFNILPVPPTEVEPFLSDLKGYLKQLTTQTRTYKYFSGSFGDGL